MKLQNYNIGIKYPPFIIAEMSGNHNQSLERALEIVGVAAETGVHAIKLQTYTADTMTLDIREGDFFLDDPNNPWKGNSLHELYQQAYTPWEWHEPIFQRAKELGLIVFSSPFDETAVDFLEKLDCPMYKIASFENVHLPLIKKVAETGKPLIISTGMASLAELDALVSTAKKNGCNDLILLKCTSTYPASPENSNIKTIAHMRDLFDVEVGLSDHTLGVGASVASIAFGATVIEKHFTLSRAEGGVDSTFSMEPSEMSMLVDEAKRAWQAIGKVEYGSLAAEEKSMVFRRSIYVCEDVKAGEVLTKGNVKIIRPGYGISPKYLETILGMKATQDICRGTPFNWELVK